MGKKGKTHTTFKKLKLEREAWRERAASSQCCEKLVDICDKFELSHRIIHDLKQRFQWSICILSASSSLFSDKLALEYPYLLLYFFHRLFR